MHAFSRSFSIAFSRLFLHGLDATRGVRGIGDHGGWYWYYQPYYLCFSRDFLHLNTEGMVPLPGPLHATVTHNLRSLDFGRGDFV